jgi:hypothetical protein
VRVEKKKFFLRFSAPSRRRPFRAKRRICGGGVSKTRLVGGPPPPPLKKTQS